MILQERDYTIFREINRWRFCLSRHIKDLCGFPTERACNRRLQMLRESGYIERKSVLYGVPRLYYLTHKAKMLINANKNQFNIRVDQINHNIAVLDTVLYFIKKDGLKLADIKSEREIQSKDGFSERRHYPDFVFYENETSYAVEVELSLKDKARLEKNIQKNFIGYDYQIWIIPKTDTSIRKVLSDKIKAYPNIAEIIDLESVREYVKLVD